ncbi:MAG: aminopeptidase P family N-terminal domain-containing protein [Actinomycetota bacterium]
MGLYFPQDEYEDRWRRVYGEMSAQGFEAALVWSRSAGGYEKFADVFFLTHYYSNQSGQADEDAWLGVGFAAVILAGSEPPQLIADLPTFPEEQVATDRIVRSNEPNRVLLVAQAMRDRGLAKGRVALVGDGFLPWRYARILQEELPGVEWIPADELVEAVRRPKSPRELDCIREGGEIVTAAMTKQLEARQRTVLGTPEDLAGSGGKRTPLEVLGWTGDGGRNFPVAAGCRKGGYRTEHHREGVGQRAADSDRTRMLVAPWRGKYRGL